VQETPKGLEVKISDDELKGRYSNLLRISHTREEFVRVDALQPAEDALTAYLSGSSA